MSFSKALQEIASDIETIPELRNLHSPFILSIVDGYLECYTKNEAHDDNRDKVVRKRMQLVSPAKIDLPLASGALGVLSAIDRPRTGPP